MKLSKKAKVLIPVFTVLVLFLALLLMPSNKLGSFGTVRASGEINQSAIFLVASEKGFARNQQGQIISFYIRDRSNALARVGLEIPASEALINAKVVELFGHMHGNEFIGKRMKILQ